MTSEWTNKWKQVLIWFSAYISFIAFAIVGGYTIVKSDDEELKATTKKAFFVTLIVETVLGLFNIINNFARLSDSYYYGASDTFSKISSVLSIAKIVTYAVFVLITFFYVKKREPLTRENVANSQPVVEDKTDNTDAK